MAIEPKYKCSECGYVHDLEDDAIECCAPRIDEVYACPVCNEYHDDEDDAMHCCNAEVAAELTVQDGMRFPVGITDTATYVKEFCEANFLRI